MASLEWIGAWALTEPNYGSDASSLATTAKKVEGGLSKDRSNVSLGRWRFHFEWSKALDWKRDFCGCDRCLGTKRRNPKSIEIFETRSKTFQVNAFVIRKGTKGLKTMKIRNKTALRCVQNADIELNDVFVPDQDRLPGVQSFQETNKVRFYIVYFNDFAIDR